MSSRTIGLLFACGLLTLAGAVAAGEDKPKAAPPKVTVSQPLSREVTDYDDYEGRIAAEKEVEVRARVRGHLKTVNFQDGQMVKEGELLYEIDPRPYEASLDANYLDIARTLAEIILERFLDREKGGFFFTSIDHEQLITRSKAAFDGSTPSGNSAAVMALLRLHGYSGEPRYLAEAERTLKLFAPFMEQQPFAFSHLLEALDLYTRGATEIVLVGDRKSPEFEFWLERLGLVDLPNRAVFAVDPNAPDGGFLPEPARGKLQIDGKLTAYVCRDRTCTAPLTSIEGLEAELRR